MPASISLNTAVCLIPTDEDLELLSRRKDGAMPNVYVSSWGEEPGFGWVLVARSDYDAMDKESPIHTLTFSDENGSVVITLLAITYAESLTRSHNSASNPDDVILVKLEDPRCFARLTTVNASYNVVRRTWLDDTNKRFTTAGDEITNGLDIIDDLWSKLPSSLFGSSPSHDVSASRNEIESPENLIYRHSEGWRAVVDAAHRMGLEVTFDRSRNGVVFKPFDLLSEGAISLIEGKSDYRISANVPEVPDVVQFPETYRVLFRKAFTDAVGNADNRVIAGEEDAIFEPYYVADITTTDVLTVSVLPGTIEVIHHDRVIVDRDFVTTDYDDLALEIVENRISSVVNDARNSVTMFSGFHDFPFKAFERVEIGECGFGPYTAVKIGDLSRYSPSLAEKIRTPPVFGFGMVTTASTKYDRSTKAVSTNGRLKPVQRDGDDTLDDSSTKELEFISFSDYPIEVGQIVQFVMDTNSMRCVAVPIGLQTWKPLFVEFVIDTGLTSPLNATITDQWWGPTLSGSDLDIEVVCSDDSGASPMYDLTVDGSVGLAFLRPDGKYHVFDMECL